MDPLTIGIISGTIVNALNAILAHIGRKGRKIFNREKYLRELIEKDTALLPILQKAMASVGRATRLGDERQTDKLRRFLVSPDIEAIVRQIYASQVTTKDKGDLQSIRAELLASLAVQMDEAEESLRELAGDLFDALLKGCERALAIAVDKGLLSAHEAKSAFRHRLILDELATIQKNLALLTATHKPNVQAILEFEEKYRQQVGARHGYITPPHFDAARKLPLDKLYVSPDFVRPPARKGEEPTRLGMHDFLGVIYRAVILGNPGGGKSTFTLKLCHDLSAYYSERLFGGRRVTPILVVIRDYGAEKKNRNCSVVQFIEATANSKYQVEPPAGAFEYLLLNGHTVVIFDGLDELLDTNFRQEISADVESFCGLYPSVPVLVTSREVGYEQAPLDESMFEIFRLSEFNDDQITNYATKWFAADLDLTSGQQIQKVQAFLEESQVVRDLRANPLMLALMCNLYRGENYIPRNRPDVYEKCALMLFERWDKSRGIHIMLPFEAHISPAMKYLAHWIYSDETLQSGVTEKSLISKATDYLCSWRFEDRDEAQKAAREFIDFCRGRAWVFTDTGTTKEGERLYQFTHRTFLEYFTAAHIVRTHATPAELWDLLRSRIINREWDVVAQLAFQLQNKHLEGAGDALLTALVEEAQAFTDEQGWNLLSFASRCLEFMVPRPRVAREITTVCTNRFFAWRPEKIKGKGTHHRKHGSDKPTGILGELLCAAAENRTTIAGNLEALILERINREIDRESLLAVEIGLHLSLSMLGTIRVRRVPEDLLKYWNSVSDRIFDGSSERIMLLGSKYFEPCYSCFLKGKTGITHLTKCHGIDGLFRSPNLKMFLDILLPSPGAHLLTFAMIGMPMFIFARHREAEFYIHQIEETGRFLLASGPPWAKEQKLKRVLYPLWIIREEPIRHEEKWDPASLGGDFLFGAFALFAPILEAAPEKEEFLTRIKKTKMPFFNSMRWIFLSRFEQVDPGKVQDEMDRCGFTAEQQAFAWPWVRREVDLLQSSVRGEKADEYDLHGEDDE